MGLSDFWKEIRFRNISRTFVARLAKGKRKSWVLEDKPIRKAYQSIMYKNVQFHFIIINP